MRAPRGFLNPSRSGSVPMFDLFKPKSPAAERKSWRERLADGLGRSREKLSGALASAFSRRTLDDETLEALETALLTADVGVAATQHLLDDLKQRWKKAGDGADPRTLLKEVLVDLLTPLERPLTVSDARPFVIMLAGVNGAGKTTSIGKLAKHHRRRACRSCSRRATPFAPRPANSSPCGASATGSR